MQEIISDREKYYHDLLLKNKNIQNDILSILYTKSDINKLDLIHEDKYINGITADFTCLYDNEISAIIEVKAGDIGVTDYVRGIGQVLQYEYFFENAISNKGYNFDSNFKSILLIPSQVISQNSFNIAKFKYPKTTLIVEINDSSKVARKITQKELDTLAEVNEDDLTSISQYYVRDIRLFEVYMLLRYLCVQKLKGETSCNRKEVEEQLKQTNTINNGNWRNAWITVSSLGFVDSTNLPTVSGAKIGMLDYEEFLYLIYTSYLAPYIDLLLNYFNSNFDNLNKSNQQIADDIKSDFNNRDVLFLTQSKGRYVSSWLNIIRDDFGALDFKPRSNNRQINYIPSELNKEAFLAKVKQNTLPYQYISNLQSIL